jgi:hypothetical protein
MTTYSTSIRFSAMLHPIASDGACDSTLVLHSFLTHTIPCFIFRLGKKKYSFLASGYGRDDDRSAAWRFHVYGPELLLFGVLWRLCQIRSGFCRFILGYCLLLGLLIFGRDGILMLQMD